MFVWLRVSRWNASVRCSHSNGRSRSIRGWGCWPAKKMRRLLLALPLVPVKPGSEILQGEWSTPGQAPQDAEGGEAVTHPFADLRKLLEGRGKHR